MASSSDSLTIGRSKMKTRDYFSVDSVQIDRVAGDGNIFGEVMLESHFVYPFYRRTINKPETRLAGDFLSLTGAPTSDACDYSLVLVSLYDGDDHHDVAVGDIYNRNYETGTSHTRSRTVVGQYGSVSVRYSFVRKAALARIEVAFPEEEARGECGAARVYGTVRARQYLGEEKGWTEVTLFGRPAWESVAVVAGGLVRMDRCLVAVPTWSYISVDVELWLAGDEVGGGDEAVASGSVEFDVDDGLSHACEVIEGGSGRHVQVSIHINPRDDEGSP